MQTLRSFDRSANFLRLETGLYLLAFLIALAVRLVNLGAAPLSDFEAGPALQALAVVQSTETSFDPQPGYLSLTSMLFYLFGSSNFLARFWPALVGSLLVWAPYIVRRRLGRQAAWIAAFGLALDPGLAAVSRLAGGPMLALTFVTLAIALAFERRMLAAGILAGLALLSGPTLLTGLLGVLFAWLLTRIIAWRTAPDAVHTAETSQSFYKSGMPAGLGLLATVILVATLLGRFPQGLGIWANTLPAYLAAWTDASAFADPVPALRLLLAVPIYQPLALIFGLVGLVSAWVRRERFLMLLSLWLLASLLGALVFPARQVYDLVWMLPPLWGVAAVALARSINISNFRATIYAHAGALFVLLALVWLNLQGLNSAVEVGVEWRWVVIAGALMLGGLASLLIAMGWSLNAAREGLTLGLLAGLGVYVLANLFGVSLVRPNNLRELWYPAPTVAADEWFEETLHDLALAATGTPQQVGLISTVDLPSLRWALHQQEEVQYRQELDSMELPPILITSAAEDDIRMVQAYSGQDFLWEEHPAWEGALPPNWTVWLTDRKIPVTGESLIIWARSDLFPVDLQIEAELELEGDRGEAVP